MSDGTQPNLVIEAAYRERTPGSAKLAAEAVRLLPSGIAHDARWLRPYGIYAARAAGCRKWDVDGNVYVDFFGGHGALLLGHNRPEVLKACQEALLEGTHYGSSHAREVRWAQLVQQIVPSAEQVRFTSSGTEATLLALRLARAFTGRRKVLRFRSQFHGWHDHMTSGYANHFDGTATRGVLPAIAESVILCDPGDGEAVRAALESDKDIAAVFVEPTGGSFGMVPIEPSFLALLRELTAKHGVPLVFDEVITGFRVAPGGAQEAYGITPDITTLAKIVAGGMPGGAVAGRADILESLDFAAMAAKGEEKVQHPGTFNANPVSAAAGIAALKIIASGEPNRRANALARDLRDRLNAILAEQQVPWAVYGTFSGFHIFTNPDGRTIDPERFDPMALSWQEMKKRDGALSHRLRLALLVNGVDISGWPGGMTSAAHDEESLSHTCEAFREALRLLRREGDIAG
ncbi:aspartate aminotransferase family protein [Marinimicrococcus flavescens]|uniref:Aminotransferase class III-fold pyridoxal phosphate-dependent enzyme n=1 Tax=Marinimicrococcus flavescens TaxID=3031815 RepID=A0AAP4D5T2_9PROT|nr:aminotransferase class III-fold pyridoxal phosphate-dependent enzyme [Marinimicrococcus flavescens]